MVFATDVSCKCGMGATPGRLRRWAKAKIGDHWTIGGWLCGKEKASGYTGKGQG